MELCTLELRPARQNCCHSVPIVGVDISFEQQWMHKYGKNSAAFLCGLGLLLFWCEYRSGATRETRQQPLIFRAWAAAAAAAVCGTFVVHALFCSKTKHHAGQQIDQIPACLIAPQSYKRCFVGKDAVKWLMEKSGRASSTQEAEALGNLLMGKSKSFSKPHACKHCRNKSTSPRSSDVHQKEWVS